MLQWTGSSPKLETAPGRTTTASEGSGHEWRGRGATSSCQVGLRGRQSHTGLLLPEGTLKRAAALLKTATPALSTAGFSTPYIEKHKCQRNEIMRSCSYRSTASPWPHEPQEQLQPLATRLVLPNALAGGQERTWVACTKPAHRGRVQGLSTGCD